MSPSPSSHLVPVTHFQTGFTTCPLLKLENIKHIDLSDKELGVHKVSSRTTHAVVSPPAAAADLDESKLPAPSHAWEAIYPKGSVNPAAKLPGGFGFYLSGPTSYAESLDKATEAILSYRVLLDSGWEWVKGGKLPGAC